MTEDSTERYATCLVWYDGMIDATLWSPDPLTTAEWDALVDEASHEFYRIERALDDTPDHVDTSGLTPDEVTAYDGGVIELLRYQHPEIQSVPFAKSEFH